MQKRRGLTMIPFVLVAIVLWCVLYQRTDIVMNMYVAGEQNPWIFVFVVGWVLYKLWQFFSGNTK